MTAPGLAIGLADIEAAAARLAGHAVRTPLLTSAVLDEAVGARVFIKPECLQRTGSFKFRGAYNRLAAMSDGERARGVVAASSGNHAQGVAEAARLFGVPATIVMPQDAPATKRLRTERSGARIVAYDREREDRVAICEAIAAETGAIFVPPYDDPFVMAGQGTAGLEMAQDLTALGLRADAVLVPVSGGGLLSGVATAFAALAPAACHPVEPEGFDDTTRSITSGRHEANAKLAGSLADALLARTPGQLTLPILKAHARPGFTAGDADMKAAVAFAARELKLICEPGGAIALAALLSGAARFSGGTVAIVLSGGNIDDAMLADCLAA
ncbi:threonine/serine dehydratase [Acuticoccus sp. MNP-M23]|uniref:threonine ammonia-lyase n=1 Tax=Acuticoccus sp. MNP-M23 TaxID=3072793 RepID=UPI0028149F5C|nr:threonine/serine dehydratase [Acuticoccus sp. MNP-M23]WMS42948.1 threonine/serine dehydratase [Acuticoccus sp. MNP-M23]